MYVDLETGELTDFLSDMEPASLHDALSKEIYTVAFFENDNFVAQRSDNCFYYFDVEKKQIYNLGEVSGKTVSNCSLLSSEVICWGEQGDFWKIDLEDMEVTSLITASQVEYVAGIQGMHGKTGSCFALYRDDYQCLCIYDFEAEECSILDEPDGWLISGDACYPSHCGRKLCMISSEGEDDISRYLVFDADTKSFLEIDVKHPGFSLQGLIGPNLQNEIVLISSSMRDFYFYKLK